MHVWNMLHAARWKYRTQKIVKKSPSENHRTTLSGYIFAIKACIDNWTKFIKQQYLLHMFLQYGELRPTNGWDLLASLEHPSKFQRVSRLAFVTAPTSLNGGQQNFAGCLAVSWAGTLYIGLYTFWGSCPVTEFCLLQNSLCVQVLRSPILAALLRGTRAAAVSQTLWRGTRNFCRGRHLYSARRPSRWGSAHILVA